VLAFLFDPVIAKNPNGFVTSLLLSATVQFRLTIPTLTLLAKSDLLSELEKEHIERWSLDTFSLWSDLCDKSADDAQTAINLEFIQALETAGAIGSMGFVSSETLEGVREIYMFVQQLLEGGEDVEN
jgi:hypothetical protein